MYTIHVKKAGKNSIETDESGFRKDHASTITPDDNLAMSFKVDMLSDSAHAIFDGIASAKELCTDMLKSNAKTTWSAALPIPIGSNPTTIMLTFDLEQKRK